MLSVLSYLLQKIGDNKLKKEIIEDLMDIESSTKTNISIQTRERYKQVIKDMNREGGLQIEPEDTELIAKVSIII